MTDDDLEPGEPVEDPAGDHAKQVHPGLDGESVDRPVQAGLDQGQVRGSAA
jgi:hypothetical protein